MRIKLVMDKSKDSGTAWCGSNHGLFKTIKLILSQYKGGYRYRRFDFTRASK